MQTRGVPRAPDFTKLSRRSSARLVDPLFANPYVNSLKIKSRWNIFFRIFLLLIWQIFKKDERRQERTRYRRNSFEDLVVSTDRRETQSRRLLIAIGHVVKWFEDFEWNRGVRGYSPEVTSILTDSFGDDRQLDAGKKLSSSI